MKHDITSSLTSFYKYIFPIGWSTLFGGVTLTMLFYVSESQMPLIFVAVWLLVSSYFFYWSHSLKFVSVDEYNLYVSASGGEVKIPFAYIKEVRESFWSNPKQITLLLREPAEFGEKVVFLPSFTLIGFISHPTAKRLKKAVKTHRW